MRLMNEKTIIDRRETDALIAEHFFGWKKVCFFNKFEKQEKVFWIRPENPRIATLQKPPRYTTDIGAASSLLMLFKSFSISRYDSEKYNIYGESQEGISESYEAVTENELPLIVCKIAFKILDNKKYDKSTN